MTDETDMYQVGSLVPATRPSPASQLPSTRPNAETVSLNRRLIAERIATLLNHFWLPSDTPEVRSQVAGDWIEDLEEFDAPTVATACQQWRRVETRKPTIADIRRLCREYAPVKCSREPKPDHDAMRRIAEENRKRFREAAQQREHWARGHGCRDFEQAMQIGLVAVSKRPWVEPELPELPPL